MNNKNNHFFHHPGRFIAICYLFILFPSAIILKSGMASMINITWMDALFTATSALTVTGLDLVNIGQNFTIIGQLWLILLMQIGGIGQMTFSMLILLIFGRKFSLREQSIVREELNQSPTTDVRRLIKSIAAFSLIVESLGIIILSFSWIPEYGWSKGLYYSIFHAVSAFNNAGFSLFSDSLASFQNNTLICLTIPFLLIIGGLGFTVIIDILHMIKAPQNWRLSLHSKLVLSTSLLLLILGTVIIYNLEHHNTYTLGNLSEFEKWLNAFFSSATARTAGFSTINMIDMTHAALLIMMILMFIGAGSSSTGGGIKVSTFAVSIIATRSFLQGKKVFCAFKRNIPPTVVLKSLAIMVVSTLTLVCATFILMITENSRFDIVLFESISAFSTVGLSAGLTENLTETGKFIIVFLMIIGRLGPLTLAFALIPSKPSNIRYADEDVITG